MEIPRYQGDINEDLQEVLNEGLATRIVGGLSHPSKMPESAWGISAFRCKTGDILAKQEGTVCSKCYARRGHYRLPHVERKLEQRLEGLSHPLWVPAMVLLIRWNISRYMRHLDSGDFQNEDHVYNTCRVAEFTPNILHWAPTQEHELIKRFAEEYAIPQNLYIRLSGRRIDGPPPTGWNITSVVYTDKPPKGSFPCPAHTQGGRCGPCRECWTKRPVIAYPLKTR